VEGVAILRLTGQSMALSVLGVVRIFTVCFQLIKVKCLVFGCLKMSGLAFGWSQFPDFASILVANSQDCDGQNDKLQNSIPQMLW